MTDVARLLENPVEATDIVKKFGLLLVKYAMKKKKKKKKKNWDFFLEKVRGKDSNREKSPTSSCVCAHPREPPTSNVISGQNTRKKGVTPPQISGSACAHPRETLRGHVISGSPIGNAQWYYYYSTGNLSYRGVGPCRLSISVSVSILQDSCKILIYSRFCF